jgi:hypothetical protein
MNLHIGQSGAHAQGLKGMQREATAIHYTYKYPCYQCFIKALVKVVCKGRAIESGALPIMAV